MRERIWRNVRTVDKIYACRYDSEFYELPNWQSCSLIIADNEISGRSNAGLAFFRNFFEKYDHLNIFGVLYTWGTNDYSKFRIQVHALHQRHTKFLGTVFKQFGDYDKIFQVIDSIYVEDPIPIFDRQRAETSKLHSESGKRELSEKLFELHQSTQERLVFYVQLLRYHLEKNPDSEFRVFLADFPQYKSELSKRRLDFKRDIKTLLEMIEKNQNKFESGTLDVLQGELHYLDNFIGAGETGDLLFFREHFKRCLQANKEISENLKNNRTNGRVNNQIYRFIDSYERIINTVSRVIKTAQLALIDFNFAE